MKKFITRALVVSSVLAVAATVAASEGPPRESGTIACWVKGTMCKNPSDCCHHSCSDDGSSFHHMRCN